jgi:hypothetical protein
MSGLFRPREENFVSVFEKVIGNQTKNANN